MLPGQLEKAMKIVYARGKQPNPTRSDEVIGQSSAIGQDFVLGAHKMRTHGHGEVLQPADHSPPLWASVGCFVAT